MVTRSGWWALGAGVVLLGVAVLTSWVPAAALGVACLVALGIALLRVGRTPPLDVERAVEPSRVTVGDLALAEVTVTNAGTRASLPMVATDRVADLAVEVALPRLAAGSSATTPYALPTERRTIVDVGPLVLSRTDPFGLVRYERRWGVPARLYVHPRVHRLRPLPPSMERSLEGQTSDTAPRGTQAFHTLREYVIGDDRRLIHWRSSARTGTLMVRQHVDTSEPDLTLVLDTRPGALDERAFEQAVEVAASFAVACARHAFPVRIHTTDGQLWEPLAGQSPATFFLDRLAGVTQRAGSMAEMAQLLQHRAGYALVLVGTSLEPDEARAVAPLSRSFDSVTLVDLTGDGTVPAGVDAVAASTAAEVAERWNAGAVAVGGR